MFRQVGLGRRFVLSGWVVVLAGCGHATAAAPSNGVSSITIVGLATYTALGIKASYQATALFNNGSKSDVTSQATWASSDTSKLAMLSPALFQMVGGGSGFVAITATYQGAVGELDAFIALSSEDCGAYTPSIIGITQALTPPAWTVFDGRELFFSLQAMPDALDTVALMQSYSTLCFVGRTNGRANRQDYILQYWKPAGPPPALTTTDCQPYNAATVKPVDMGGPGWALTDGNTQIALLNSESDADLLLPVAKQSSSRCFIGRANGSSSTNSVVTYWK